MPQIVALGSYSDSDQAALTALGAVTVASNDELRALSDADRATVEGLAFKGHQPFGAAEMALLPALRVIANYGVGYDAIDVAAATARGIQVTNTPDVLSDDVADLAVGMLIAQVRDFETGIKAVRTGTWATTGDLPLSRKMSGRRVGVLGLGRIGREIADRLAAFKSQIHYWSRSEKDTPAGWVWHDDPVALAGAVDDLVIALVGGPDTKDMVSAKVIEALGPDGVVVNISRGSVIDEAALIEALQNGGLRGAALDVFQGEPKIDPRLAQAPNVLPLPHIGSATVETRAAMGELQRRNLTEVLAGRPPITPVNAPKAST
ncbi:2-hydroxyacid dehydrogenase [Paracoccus pacificus]|uniref:2-hydroxyacid dehydrogenase n=1 Tax=Paracoccus pacificus TaxID=1463598 RepID=A0ABW4R3Z6_9RHOB